MITQSELQYKFTYDRNTGIFRLRHKVHTHISGKRVGAVNRKHGYRQIVIEKTLYFAHKLAWLYEHGVYPGVIDHYNHARDDNRISNLSISSYAENNKNQGMRKDNNSDFTGVNFHKATGKWCAQVMVDRKKKWLGVFKLKSDAIKARMEANTKYGFHVNHGIQL